jgi:probable addiction module antidote protein
MRLGRESLYKALAPGAKPQFDAILKVARALGANFPHRWRRRGTGI